MHEPTHLDLFSGIGGFALAAKWAGFRTVAFCEIDARCRAFLEKTWGVPVEPDIKKLDGRRYAGVSLLTGGPPCQPASRAGKQGGAGDDRWLWPEALRVLEEAQPDCVVFENPPGILDVGIDGILSEMGRCGYEVQPFDIPACGVDSPQLRHRIWFVGFHMGNAECRGEQRGAMQARGENRPLDRTDRPATSHGGSMADTGCERSGENEQEWRQNQRATDWRDCAGQLAHPEEARREGHGRRGVDDGTGRRQEQDGPTPALRESLMADSDSRRPEGISEQDCKPIESEQQASRWDNANRRHWQNAVWVPCADGKLRRAPDDSFHLVDGLHRSLLAALGNSVNPQTAFQILRVIRSQI